MYPALSLRTFTPSSSAAASFPFGPGVVEVVHRMHGQTSEAPVGNDHVRSAASALPATSLMPVAPPFTVAVYVVPEESGAPGVSVAIPLAYATVAETGVAPARRLTFVVVTLAAASASLNVTVTAADGDTPTAFAAGFVLR